MPTRPPKPLVDRIVDGPSLITRLEWHDEVGSTNEVAAAEAAGGASEGHAVVTDLQTAGRARRGRGWRAPSDSSLLWSVVLRPAGEQLELVPLAVGLAVAEACEAHLKVEGDQPRVVLKWPNDVLIDERKVAGVLVESADAGRALVAGMGVNVDWRGVQRPEGTEQATSLAEAAGDDVDRFELLAGLAETLTARVGDLRDRPDRLLEDYRRRCVTIGRPVKVMLASGDELVGTARNVAEDGALAVAAGRHVERVLAGEVVHLRPA